MRLLTPEKIVSVLFYADKNGKVEPADDGKLLRVEGKEVLLGNDVEVRDVVTFEEIGSGQTKLTFKRSHWDDGRGYRLEPDIRQTGSVCC